MSQMIENLYFFSCATLIVCQHFFYFSFYEVEQYHLWSKRQKKCLHLPMENSVFSLEKDGGEYSRSGTMCLNEGIKEISKTKNGSSCSFFVKLV